MKKITYSLFLFIMILSACGKEETREELDCKAFPHVVDTLDGVSFYIPNVFSSQEKDGINDHFQIFSKKDEIFVDKFEIKDQQGVIVFNKIGFYATPFENRDNGFQPELGTLEYKYSYTIEMTGPSGTQKTVQGVVFDVGCGRDPEVWRPYYLHNVYDCHFTTQHNGNGGLDPLANSFENLSGCVK